MSGFGGGFGSSLGMSSVLAQTQAARQGQPVPQSGNAGPAAPAAPQAHSMAYRQLPQQYGHMGSYNTMAQDLMRGNTGMFNFGGGGSPFNYSPAYHNQTGGGQYGYSGMGINSARQQGGGFGPQFGGGMMNSGGWGGGGWGGSYSPMMGGYSPMMQQAPNPYFTGGWGGNRGWR